MTDTAKTLIEEVRVRLDALTSGEWSEDRWVVGELDAKRHDSPPRISWVTPGGTIGTPKLQNDTEEDQVGTRTAEYAVTIWHTSDDNCIATLTNLFNAMRKVAAGPNFTMGPRYEWLAERHMNRGRALTVTVEIQIPVTATPVDTVAVPMEDHEHEVSVGGEVIC